MNGKNLKAAEATPTVPLAELVIRVGDSRPVVLTMDWDFQKTGEVKLSKGPLEDMLLARFVCTFMQNAIADELWEREKKVIADFTPETEAASVDADDIPF